MSSKRPENRWQETTRGARNRHGRSQIKQILLNSTKLSSNKARNSGRQESSRRASYLHGSPENIYSTAWGGDGDTDSLLRKPAVRQMPEGWRQETSRGLVIVMATSGGRERRKGGRRETTGNRRGEGDGRAQVSAAQVTRRQAQFGQPVGGRKPPSRARESSAQANSRHA